LALEPRVRTDGRSGRERAESRRSYPQKLRTILAGEVLGCGFVVQGGGQAGNALLDRSFAGSALLRVKILEQLESPCKHGGGFASGPPHDGVLA
jgi:hypothetical protein